MKRSLLVSALVCAIFVLAAPLATAAGHKSFVVGAGFSTVSGPFVISARATEPIDSSNFENVPAVGFLRAPQAANGRSGPRSNLSGTVTCMGFINGQVAVSGRLDTPFAQHGVTFPNFTMLIWGGRGVGARGDTPIWITPSIVPGPGAGPCGTQLFFLAGLPEEVFPNPEYHLIKGNIIIGDVMPG